MKSAYASKPSVEHRFLPFNTCDARVGKISFPVVYFYFASFDRGEEPVTFLLAKENASKCHKASHEDYSWLQKPIDDDIESLLKLMPPTKAPLD